jgi:hypothetical protein
MQFAGKMVNQNPLVWRERHAENRKYFESSNCFKRGLGSHIITRKIGKKYFAISDK